MSEQKTRNNLQEDRREFVSERELSAIVNRSVKTLQKDRLFGRGFPFYRFGRQILYNVNECRELIRGGRVETSGGRAA